jgi:hypothetical protein
MRRAERLILVFVTTTSVTSGCLIDRGDLLVASRDVGWIDASTLIDAGGASSGCAAGLTLCSGTCVDLTSDPTHCGGCETACDEGQSCIDRTCTGCFMV